MLIKKKLIDFSSLLFIKSIFTKLLLGLGFIFSIIIILSTTYYFSSGLSNTHGMKGAIIKINNKI